MKHYQVSKELLKTMRTAKFCCHTFKIFHLLSSPLVPTTATPEVPFVTLGELPWFHIFGSMLKVQLEKELLYLVSMYEWPHINYVKIIPPLTGVWYCKNF